MLTGEQIAGTAIYRRVLRLMGNRFEISVVAEAAAWANERIDSAVSEIQRIEQLFTTYDPDSQTNRINAQAGMEPVKVDREMIELIERAHRISELTQGAFDLSYGSIDRRLWNFDKTMTALPDPATAKKMVRLINYKNIITDKTAGTVFLKNRGMRIGFGGIGKGYAAERAKYILQQEGVKSGIVNAAGDLTVWGHPPDGTVWTIGIVHPDAAGQPFSSLDVTGLSVATSGNYEKFAWIDGKKYSHTIDPKTGYPVTGIKSVTIISPNAELSDALATPVMVMGIQAGLHLINQLKQVSCMLIDEDNHLYASKNIYIK